MATTKQVSYAVEKPNQYPHIEWVEIHSDGILHETAIMKREENGNILFFKVDDLDQIDRKRLAEILTDRSARSVELYDLMANRTLNNGVNALVYFAQLTKQLTPNGKILDTRTGQKGTGVAVVKK